MTMAQDRRLMQMRWRWLPRETERIIIICFFASSPLFACLDLPGQTAKTYDVDGHENAWGRGKNGMLLGDNKLVFKTQ